MPVSNSTATPRLVLSLIIIALACPGSLGARYRLEKRPNSTSNDLRLIISIEHQTSCYGDAEVYSEVLDLATHYTNRQKTAMTIFLGSDVATQVVVGRTPQELKAGKYESESSRDVFPADGDRYLLGEKPQSERPSLLRPGQSADWRSSTAVIVRKSEFAKIPGTVTSGSHFLQVRMLIRVSEADKSGLAQAEGSAYHWISVWSQAVPLQVPADPKLEDCSTTH